MKSHSELTRRGQLRPLRRLAIKALKQYHLEIKLSRFREAYG